MTAYGGHTVTAAVRLLVPLTIISIALAALAGILVIQDGGTVSGREGRAIAAPLITAVISIATLCYLATAGTRYWAVGVIGGLIMGWSAAYTVLLIWGQLSTETDAMVRVHTVGLIITVALAQIALLLGVAGDRPRLRVVLWPTVALSVAATALATSLALNEEKATDDELRALVALAIVNALGTLTTLALALFGNRSPKGKSPLAARLIRSR